MGAEELETGGDVVRRHNALRDIIAKRVEVDLGLHVHIEQRQQHLGRLDEKGNILLAVLDVVIHDGNRKWLLDVTSVTLTVTTEPW